MKEIKFWTVFVLLSLLLMGCAVAGTVNTRGLGLSACDKRIRRALAGPSKIHRNRLRRPIASCSVRSQYPVLKVRAGPEGRPAPPSGEAGEELYYAFDLSVSRPFFGNFRRPFARPAFGPRPSLSAGRYFTSRHHGGKVSFRGVEERTQFEAGT